MFAYDLIEDNKLLAPRVFVAKSPLTSLYLYIKYVHKRNFSVQTPARDFFQGNVVFGSFTVFVWTDASSQHFFA
jgi:hypothetical protein